MKLILASNSPRRRELLRNAGIDFDVVPSGVEEGPPAFDEFPEQYAQRLAREKALSVASKVEAGRIVLAADTIVVSGDLILGKPSGPLDATRMLRRLSGQTHRVVTAICLIEAPNSVLALDHESTLVTFRELTEDEIRAYVESGEPFDKAGGYAIPGLGSRFIVHISGCYFNVVGLPVALLYDILQKNGHSPS